MSTMPIRAVRIVAVAAIAVALLLASLAVRAPAASAASPCPGAGSSHLPLRVAEGVVGCLINAERTRRGLRPLAPDGRLVRVARRHSAEQFRFRFLGHTSPKRGSLVRRMKRSGFGRGRGRWTFGEILGGGRGRNFASPRFIVRQWMRRRVHRHAILTPQFTSFGIGAVRGTPSGGRRRGGRNYVVTFGG